MPSTPWMLSVPSMGQRLPLPGTLRALSVIAGVELPRWNDPNAERDKGYRDELEVRQAQRDPDDRQAQRDARGQVADREPPAEQDDPDDIADQRSQARVAADLDRPAE